MFARYIFSTILVACLCAVALCGLSAQEKDAVKAKVSEMHKNLAFHMDFSKLNVKNELQTAEKKILKKTKNNDQAGCVRGAGQAGLIEGNSLVDSTIGVLMRDLGPRRDALNGPNPSEADWDKANTLIQQTDYTEYIEKATDAFDDAFPIWLQSQEAKMLKCVK